MQLDIAAVLFVSPYFTIYFFAMSLLLVTPDICCWVFKYPTNKKVLKVACQHSI